MSLLALESEKPRVSGFRHGWILGLKRCHHYLILSLSPRLFSSLSPTHPSLGSLVLCVVLKLNVSILSHGISKIQLYSLAASTGKGCLFQGKVASFPHFPVDILWLTVFDWVSFCHGSSVYTSPTTCLCTAHKLRMLSAL